MGEFSEANKVTYMPSYEGASTSYRMEQKGLIAGDQDTLAARELQNLWKRSHYLTRNNAIGATAKHRLVTNWVGTGIKIRWMNENGLPADKVQKKWDKWLSECTIDGYGNFNNFQKDLANAFMESGEAIGRLYINKRKSSEIPLALQLVEAEQLCPLFTDNGDPNTRNGITFDSVGKPTKYHLWKRHPGSLSLFQNPNDRVAVDASDIIHLFERQRPGQWRGVPFLAPVMLNIYEIDELIDATLQRQKAAQGVSWIIENTNPLQAFAPGTVRNVSNGEIDPATGLKRKIIQGSAGSVHYLNKGETFKFASIQDIGPNLGVLLQDEIGKIATALGLTYDQLTGDLSQVNFSSIRAGLNEFRVRTEIIQRCHIINLALLPIAMRWLELFALYVPRIGTTGVYPLFTLPRRYGVDELKDGQADLLEVQAGFDTMQHKLEERDVTFQEVVEDRKRAEKSGFLFTSIPAMPQATPNQQPEKIQKQDSGTTNADKPKNKTPSQESGVEDNGN